MPEELKKFQKEYEVLQKDYNKLWNEFNRPGDRTEVELNSFQKSIDEFQKRHKELEDKTINPTKNALKSVSYHVDQIQNYLGNVERGIDATGEIEKHLKSLKDLFERFEEVKRDLKNLKAELEDLENDIDDERKKIKTSSLNIREVISLVMKKTKQSMASST